MKRAFTLIETLIYIWAIMLLSLVFISMMNYYLNLKLSIVNIHSEVEIIVGFKLLLEDVKNVSSYNEDLKLIEENSLIFKYKNNYYQWVVISGRLYKIIGKRFKNKSWVKRRSNLVAQNIKSLKFDFVKDLNNKIIGINVFLESVKNKKYYGFVCLNNGIVI